MIDDHIIELTIHEGRYHQIKRMMAAVGNHVATLHRLRVGAITLDSALAPGEFRALTPEETASAG
jgi:16S rRNA pseudouridine516 synthase